MHPEAVTQAEFLAAISYGVPADHYRELRLFVESKKGQPPIERDWLHIGGNHAERLAELTKIGANSGAGVFYSVLPRGAYGGGKSEDATAAAVVWADLDKKDYGNDEGLMRSSLDAFPIAPAIVVWSGHGLHAFWLLTELCAPELLSALAKLVGKAVGGDSVHDAARMLRLPGTVNLKDPNAPIPVVIEVFEPERRISPMELERAASNYGSDEPEDPSFGFDGPDETDPPDDEAEADKPIDMSGMPGQVGDLLKTHKKLRDLFIGVGKPSHGRNGEALDQTASGYDFSFTFELAKKHVLDPDILASAMVCRPDGHARSQGARYVRRTVGRVLERLKPKRPDVLFHIGIDRVEILESDPVVYLFHIGDRHFRLDAAGLLAPMKFTEAYLQVASRTPAIPHKKAEWLPWVDALIYGAERVVMPPDASAEAVLHERIIATIETLPVTSELAELDSKVVQLDDGRRAFKPATIRKHLLDDFKDLSHATTCRVLRAHGYDAASHRVGGRTTRLWAGREVS